MSVQLTQEIIALIKNPESVKVLATTAPDGTPHAVYKGSINIDENGRLFSLELIESSETNSNLVHSLWFTRRVAISVRSVQGESVQIKAVPERCLVSGPVFEEYYRKLREKRGDVDLAAVWYYTPLEVKNNAFGAQYEQEREKHPLFLHLDRIAKTESEV